LEDKFYGFFLDQENDKRGEHNQFFNLPFSGTLVNQKLKVIMEKSLTEIDDHEEEVQHSQQQQIYDRIRRRETRKREIVTKQQWRILERRSFVRMEKERKQMHDEDIRMIEINSQVHPFYNLKRVDPYGKKVQKVETGLVYFGHSVPKSAQQGKKNTGIFIPHGEGKLYMDDGTILYEGGFHYGKMHGKGSYTFQNGDRWVGGTFHFDLLHGIGSYEFGSKATQKEKTDAIYYQNKRLCFTNELSPGTSIIIKQLFNGTKLFHNRSAIILDRCSNKKSGYYMIKTEEGKICSMNLANIYFVIDHAKVKTLPIESVLTLEENKEEHSTDEIETKHFEKYYRYIPQKPNIHSSHDENWFFEECKDAQELREILQKRREEVGLRLYKDKIKELEDNKIKNFVDEQIRRNALRKEKIKRKIIHDAALHETETENLERNLIQAREMKEKNVADSRRLLAEYEKSINWNMSVNDFLYSWA